MAGVESASGSRARAGFVPDETMGGIERLEAAGAVIFARTAVPEFCYFGITESDLLGRTSNPWDPGRVPGGSSGGAAVAVAAGAGTLSLGGDGGGSIRIPAAFCGVVGFKPTFGLVAHEPSSAGWKTLVAVGPLARSVADARLMLRAVAGPDPRDRHGLTRPASTPRRPTRRTCASGLRGPRVRAARRRRARASSATRSRRSRRRGGARARLARARLLGGRVGHDRHGRGPMVGGRRVRAPAREPHAGGRGLHRGRRARRRRALRPRAVRARAHPPGLRGPPRPHGATRLVTPTLGCEAFPTARATPTRSATCPSGTPTSTGRPSSTTRNLAGLPACALPIGLGDDGLPVSVQVLGPRAGDGAVLAAAEVIERVVGFDARPPAPVPTPSSGPPEKPPQR